MRCLLTATIVLTAALVACSHDAKPSAAPVPASNAEPSAASAPGSAAVEPALRDAVLQVLQKNEGTDFISGEVVSVSRVDADAAVVDVRWTTKRDPKPQQHVLHAWRENGKWSAFNYTYCVGGTARYTWRRDLHKWECGN